MATKLTFPMLACVLLAATDASPQQTGGIPGGITSGIVGGVPAQPGAPQKTEAELEAAIATRPSDVSAYLQLAQLYRMNNRIPEADQVLRSALAVVPNTEMVYGMLVGLYSPTYNAEQVLAIAGEWRQAQPTSVRPLMSIVAAHVELAKRSRLTPHEAHEHLEHAARAVEDAKSLNPDLPAIGMMHAMVLQAKAESETDPAERARLLREAAEVMQQTRMRGNMPAPFTAPPGTHVTRLSVPGAIRVGGNIRPPQKIQDVKPQYPPEAQQARIQGVVILEVVIDEGGKVKDAQVLRSIPMLDAAAMDAVRQWEFAPTLLNGQGVPVIMTVTVQFSLQ